MTKKPKPSPQNQIGRAVGQAALSPRARVRTRRTPARYPPPKSTMRASIHGSSVHSVRARVTVSSGGPWYPAARARASPGMPATSGADLMPPRYRAPRRPDLPGRGTPVAEVRTTREGAFRDREEFSVQGNAKVFAIMAGPRYEPGGTRTGVASVSDGVLAAGGGAGEGRAGGGSGA